MPEHSSTERDVPGRLLDLDQPVTRIMDKAATQRAVVLAIAFTLLNLPYWWLQEKQFLSRPFLNVELFLPLLIAARSLPVASTTLTILWALDWASSNSWTFYFSSPLDFVRSATFLPLAQAWSFLSVPHLLLLAPFIVFGAASLLLCRREFDRRPPWPAALSLIFAIIVVDVANGSSMLLNLPSRWFNGNPAGSPAVTLMVKAYQQRGSAGFHEVPSEGSTRKDIDVLAWARAHPDRSVLFVIVESLGTNRDERLQQWLLDRLAPAALRADYTVKETQVPFNGSTTSAELRELCGLRGSYRNITPTIGSRCLPQQLQALGWRTEGFHGFSGQMFSRDRWWHNAGIARASFATDLLRPGQATCGAAFAGACDEAVIARAGEALRQRRTFAYVLTLNSHLPLQEVDIPASLAAICKPGSVRHEVCLLTATLGIALEAVAKAALSSSVTMPLVVVVGDHAPPFSDRETRSGYSQSRIPAYVLTPTAAP